MKKCKIDFYRDMQRLNLGKNKLKAVPHESLAGLTYLETLELSGNQIKDLEPGIFNGQSCVWYPCQLVWNKGLRPLQSLTNKSQI